MSSSVAVRHRSFTVVVLLSVCLQLLWSFHAAGANSVFADVSGVHQATVDTLAAAGTFRDTECGETRFCPDEPLDRWIAAVWLVRAVDGGDPPGVAAGRFSDVLAGEWWAPHVERLAELGVTRGCVAELDVEAFCPDSPITRGQMATFLVTAFGIPSVDSSRFVDTEGNVHEHNINALAAEGITAGCSSEQPRYCPSDYVTRGQMATFLARALGLVPLPEDPVPSNPPQRIAFHSRVRDGVYDVFVVDADGSNRRRLTMNNDTGFPGFYGKPSWSPDGTMVAFRSEDRKDGGEGDWEISVAHVDGSGISQLTDNEWSDIHPDFSHDGRIAYVSLSHPGKREEIRVMAADGSDVQILTPPVGFNVRTPRWSPDSSMLVLTDDSDIWIVNVDGSSQRQLTDNDMWNEQPVWSPDGTLIAFHARTIVYDQDEAVFKSLDDSEIYVVDLEDGDVQQLTENERDDYAPSWSPDGTRIAFESYLDDSFGYELFVMDADGTNQQRLTTLPGGDRLPEWSPNGVTIVFARDAGIYLINADGMNLRQLTYGWDDRPAWWGSK